MTLNSALSSVPRIIRSLLTEPASENGENSKAGGKDSDCNNICAEWHVSSPSPPFLACFIPLSFISSLLWTIGEEGEQHTIMASHCEVQPTDAKIRINYM